MLATYRATPDAEPVPCEILSEREPGIVVCRHVGRPLAGVWRARVDQMGPPAGLDEADFQLWLRRNLQQLGAL